MYKILLIDDDCLVRQTLSNTINWENYGFQVIGEAIDGIDGMEKIELYKPDIIILDMSMPQADGIEVIKYVKKIGHNTKILVLSCYDDFDYVKEALKLGANDYMLKHLMKEKTLVESLQAIKHDIESERKENQAMNHMEEIAKEGASLLKNKFLLELLHAPVNFPKTEQEFIRYCKNLQPNNLALIYIRVEDYKKLIKNGLDGNGLFDSAFSKTIAGVLESNCNYEIAKDEEGQYVIFINLKNHGQLENKKYLMCIMEKMGEKLSTELNMRTRLISSIAGTSYSKLWKTYEQLCNKINHFFYEKLDTKYLIAEEYESILLHEIRVDDNQIRKYKEYIKKSQFPTLREEVVKELDEIANRRIKEAIIKRYFLDLIGKIYSYIYEHFNIKRDHEYIEKMSQRILEAKNVSDFSVIVLDVVQYLEMLVSNDLVLKVENEYIKEAIKYIQCHYSEDIILTDVANHIHVSATYFSYLFKQHTGVKFIDYIKEVRMKKACEYLLDENMKIKKIGEMVGIPNRKYFSKSFKEYTGLSPQEYKRKNI